MLRPLYLSLLLVVSQSIMLLSAYAQTTLATPNLEQVSKLVQTRSGGTIYGTVQSGNIPLPGVTVTAQNTLTGKTYYAASGATGAYSMTIPDNGRYVIRAQFAAFAQPRITRSAATATRSGSTIFWQQRAKPLAQRSVS